MAKQLLKTNSSSFMDMVHIILMRNLLKTQHYTLNDHIISWYYYGTPTVLQSNSKAVLILADYTILLVYV